MKIAIAGALGRMGKTLVEYAEQAGDTVSAVTVRAGSEDKAKAYLASLGLNDVLVTDDIGEALDVSDAVIDFTFPAYTLEIAKSAADKGKIHISGTTGYSEADKEKISTYAAKTPIIMAPNMSIGVNILMSLVEKVSVTLDAEYDIEIYELHHKHKKDAPSGTALGLGRAAAAGRGVALEDVSDIAREGIIGERETGHIGFSVARGGDVVGDHVVTFAGTGERIELGHKASSRTIYAVGAYRAAHWADGKKPGLYSMQDVLRL